MSWGSRRLAAGVAATCAAGAATLTIATGTAAAAPDKEPVLARTCSDFVAGAPGPPVALDSDAVADALQQASGVVQDLLPESERLELPQQFEVGEIGKTIGKQAVVSGMLVALPTDVTTIPGVSESLEQSLIGSLSKTGCAIAVTVLPTEPLPQQPPPQQPPPQESPQQPPQGKKPPRETAPPEPSNPAPRPPAERQDPPKRNTAEPVAPAQPRPQAPMLAPPDAPDAGALGNPGVPIFDSPLDAGSRVPGVRQGQNLAGAQPVEVQRAGHAVALPGGSEPDRRDQTSGLLAGVLALSGVLAGLVRATARRGVR